MNQVSRSGFLVVGVVAAGLALPGCQLDTHSIAPAEISAVPEYVCPCEPVTVEWRCPRDDDDWYCDSVRFPEPRTPSPYIVTYTAGDTSGRQDLPQVCEDTVFNIATTHSGRTSGDTTSVRMVAEAGMQREQFSFPGRCAGANAVWDDLELKQRLSRCLAVQSLRNVSAHNISITSDVWGGPVRLGRGEVTGAFNGEPSNLSVAVTDDFSAYCGDVSSGGPPPSIEIELTLLCDRSLDGCDS